MELLENIIAVFSPKRAAERAYWKHHGQNVKRLYEAAQQTVYHKQPRAQGSADRSMDQARSRVRDWARYLDENHDLAIGIFDELVNKIVGTGITLEPLAAGRGGKPNAKLNKEISKLWRRWAQQPDVTGEMDFNELQRLTCRSWVRDGEILAQHVLGRKPGIDYSSAVPYALEMIEADYLPFDFIEERRNIIHGVEKNSWGRPRAYHVLKRAPDDRYYLMGRVNNDDVRRITADRISHVKFTRRFGQTRGVSVIHGVAHRLDDIKDYEESERIAARIDASFAGFIRKGGDYDSNNAAGKPERVMEMQGGMIFDDLLPGEDIGTIGSNRPNSELSNFRNSQLKAIASGTGTSYSSISRNYDGTYSAQRQEMVESAPAYSRMRGYFITAYLMPAYRNFIDSAILSGALKIPAGVEIETVYDAAWIAPPMPWIDPKKEIESDAKAIELGIKTTSQIIRERTGREPEIVREQVQAERMENAKNAAAVAAENPAPAAPAEPAANEPAAPDNEDTEDAAA